MGSSGHRLQGMVEWMGGGSRSHVSVAIIIVVIVILLASTCWPVYGDGDGGIVARWTISFMIVVRWGSGEHGGRGEGEEEGEEEDKAAVYNVQSSTVQHNPIQPNSIVWYGRNAQKVGLVGWLALALAVK